MTVLFTFEFGITCFEECGTTHVFLVGRLILSWEPYVISSSTSWISHIIQIQWSRFIVKHLGETTKNERKWGLLICIHSSLGYVMGTWMASKVYSNDLLFHVQFVKSIIAEFFVYHKSYSIAMLVSIDILDIIVCTQSITPLWEKNLICYLQTWINHKSILSSALTGRVLMCLTFSL